MFRISLCNASGIILLLTSAADIGDVGAEDVQVSATSAGSSWHWTPDEWVYTEEYEEIQGYAQRPDDDVLQSMTVEWQPPELDALGNFCTVRGRLSVPGNGAEGRRPVDWFQGVTVYMAKTPGSKPDWSAGMNQVDTLDDTTLVSTAGEFAAVIDVRKTQHDRTLPEPFQFGLALAQHTITSKSNQQVVWDSKAPAMAATVQMQTVPAAGRLSRELELINRASGWPFQHPNGVDLIRAVNALQRLGKERALATLEEYAEMTSGIGYFEEQEIVFWIVRTLFEPIRLDDRIPRPLIAVWLDDEELPPSARWPLNPMAVVDDVPFMLGHQVGMGGVPEPPAWQIEWARRHGVVRDAPLKPAMSPLLAAEVILGSHQFRQLDEYARDEATRSVRAQAYAMAAGLLPPITTERLDDTEEEIQWRNLVEESAVQEIRWDAGREEFVGKPR